MRSPGRSAGATFWRAASIVDVLREDAAAKGGFHRIFAAPDDPVAIDEAQRTQGAKVKLTLEIQAEANDGFADGEVSVVRDNARQLKFKAESTGFEE